MSSRGLEIRKFEESDYQEVVKLQNVISPWTKSSVESLKHLDENFPEKCKHQRYIAELDGEVIGHASYSQWEGSYEPGKFSIYGAIHPDRQGEGYGAELYQHVMKELDEYDPIKLKANTKEGKERAIRFLKDRGFREMNRVWELELDVDSFDLEKDGRSEENLDEDGIGITTLKEIGNDENNRRKIYGLFEEIMEDIPGSEEFTGMDYDQFIERIFNRPIFSPECTIIVEKDGRFIGMLIQYDVEEENAIYTGLGGVRRKHRKKGVATAMLTRAVEIAEKKGVSKMKTESMNESILKILEKLNFDKRPGRIELEKTL